MITHLQHLVLMLNLVTNPGPSETAPDVSAQNHKPILLVSDIDDTIKATHIRSFLKLPVLINGPRLKNAFAGMAQLYSRWLCADLTGKERDRCLKYNGINAQNDREIFYVTGAKGRLQLFSNLFLDWSGFPSSVYRGKSEGETSEFKISEIEKIVSDFSEFDIILIGDNGEKDPEVFDYINQNYSDKRNIYAFVHSLYDIPIPENQIPFVTAADLAVHFYNNGWISEEDLQDITQTVLNSLETKPKLVVPNWARIPELNDFWPEITRESQPNTTKCIAHLKSLISTYEG